MPAIALVLALTAVANITLSTHALAFNAIDSTQQYVPASAITMQGTIVTGTNGSASIDLLAPANITGSSGGLLRISYFSLTCSGAALPGETFVATKAQLVASSSVTCATYSSGFDSNVMPGGQLNFTMLIFLDDRTLDNDTYPATNFSVVATAT